VFITFEGTEGSGKSLQTRKLVERLREHAFTVLATHEPGGTPLGTELRRLLLDREELQIGGRAEALLMNASRAQLVETVIRPALERGGVVVCDRFADSTLAYQGAGRGLNQQDLGSVISFATAGLQPDMTMLLDVPVEVGLARKQAQNQRNRFEEEAVAFHTSVRTAYLALAAENPARWRCFDATQSADRLSEAIWGAVVERMGIHQ
jgi:dTMP kinase